MDHAKHIATLSVACIVTLITFGDSITDRVEVAFQLRWGLLLLLASVVFSVLFQAITIIGHAGVSKEDADPAPNHWLEFFGLAMYPCFVVAIGFLAWVGISALGDS